MSDILSSIDDESKKTIPDEGEEEKSEDILNDVDDKPQDDLPDPRQTDPKKNLANIIEAEFKKVAAGEKDLNDVPEYCRDDVEKQLDALKEVKRDEKLSKVKEELLSEIAAVKEKQSAKEKQEDRENASKILDTYLASGINREDFDKDHRTFFTDTVKEKLATGVSWTEAVEMAIGKLVSRGVVPDVSYAIEQKRSQGGRFYGGGDAPMTGSSRKFEEYSREAQKVGVVPASTETYKKMEEQGLL